MILRRAAPAALSILLPVICAKGQSPVVPKKFDVASIKAYRVQDGNFMVRPQPDGGFRAVGATLKMLIMYAYNVKVFQVSGAPGWAATELWEIQAKAEALDGRPSRADTQARVRALLGDRFQLKVHLDRRTMPVYALVATKSSGSKLAAATGEAGICPCGPASYAPTRATMAMLADQLSTRLWRVVIDKTGMKREYAFKLAWTPAPNEYGPEALGLPPRTEASPLQDDANPAGPSISTALKEQLGLRLESQKGPVEIVVIDGVEHPSEN